MNSKTAELSLTPLGVARTLGLIALVLIMASLGGQILKFGFGHGVALGFVRLFDVNAEQNIPTYFSVILLLLAALLLAVETALARPGGIRAWWPWAFLSLGFLFMGYDEAFQLHEQLVAPMTRLLGSGTLGIFYFVWVVPGIVLVFLLTLLLLRFLLRLPQQTRRRFVLAAAVYLAGAIGLEMVGGWYAELSGRRDLLYNVIGTVEEGLEMAGVIAFLRALLLQRAENGGEIRIRFT